LARACKTTAGNKRPLATVDPDFFHIELFEPCVGMFFSKMEKEAIHFY